ncbi:hypothetical protein D3P07_14730 [Paenibacillus sp. 1011MAR3C5]|uniref:hypothetical protein n=1 Tax=Paenibacillus sp. 1011MAR3C5 TaxID=1675787 RepID=UPI000E6CED38|nr:hypothetical protein [Paenibacillus sp. 1011MAR3C5]RJE87571.1 hypothetical protein D3P07_14730 [Paenibacillus sp. 1011MAR3C5]
MKLPFRNTILMLVAAVTLYGALASPPAPEQASIVAPVLSAHSQSAFKLASAKSAAYTPLHELVNEYSGQLTYNRETDTIDLTVDGANFSLLLKSGSVLQNGYEAPGDYYMENRLIYISADQFAKLAALTFISS